MRILNQNSMNRRRIVKQVCLLFAGSILYLSPLQAQEDDIAKMELTTDVQKGMDLFQGNKSFKNGGPACIVCHNVSNENVFPGGLFAKDLTEISETFPGVGGWLMNPDRPAMIASYKDHQVVLEEGQSIEAFLNYANANKESKASISGEMYMIIGGLIGLVVIMVLITFIWRNKKSKMVKRSIFDRQLKTPDAKF